MALLSAIALKTNDNELIVAMPTSGRLTQLFAQAGFETRIASYPVARKSALRGRAAAAFALHTAKHLFHTVSAYRRDPPGVTYVNTLTAPTWVLASWLTRVPVVIHVRESETDAGIAWRILTLQCRLAQRVVCNSASTMRALGDAKAVHPSRATVIYNGRLTGEETYTNDGRVAQRICLVGRLAPRKGQTVAVDAMTSIVRECPEAQLLIAGDVFAGYEWFRERLERQIQDLHLENNVSLLGFLEDATALYETSSICIVPSLVEPFGNVAVEAMAAGAAVVASDVQGLAEIVRDGETGVLVPPGDSEQLASRVLQLFEDPERVAGYQRWAHEDVIARFSTKTYSRKLRNVIEEVLRK